MGGFDINNNFRGTYYGKDRLGFTTPDADSSDWLRPWIPVPYPAPWLPGLRRDDAHPVGAQVVISSHQLVGLDASGALVPAGYFSGSQAAAPAYTITGSESPVVTAGATSGVLTISHIPDSAGTLFANAVAGDQVAVLGMTTAGFDGTYNLTSATYAGSAWTLVFDNTGLSYTATTNQTAGTIQDVQDRLCLVVYGSNDVGFAVNPQKTSTSTLVRVAAAGEHVLLGCPTNLVGGFTYYLYDGTAVTVSTGDVTFAKTCTLIPGPSARAIGYVVRNVWQFLGGVLPITSATGMVYTLDTMIPYNFRVSNYMHEMGTAIQTRFVLRVPYIGSNPGYLGAWAAANSSGNPDITAYTQTDFSRSFVHAVGTKGNASGNLYNGCSVVPSKFEGDYGNYAPYNSVFNSADEIVGQVLGIEHMYPIKDFADRVRTQFDRMQELVGPFREPNPTIGLMGGSATRGMDYAISLATNSLFRESIIDGVTPPEASYSYGIIHVDCR